MKLKPWSAVIAGFLTIGFAGVPAAARNQDLERVRALYGSAAYEEALAAMPPVSGAPASTDLEQYRALCLLALGREAEAIAAVERLVRDHPTFVPPAGDTSPRLQSMFDGVRSTLVPELARQAYLDSRTAFEAKNGPAARAGFQRTLDLIESLPETGRTALADLRLLAAEFLDLLVERTATAPPAVPDLPVQSPPKEAFSPPVALTEAMPPWNPPDGTAMRTEYAGLLRIMIGADGLVESATIVRSSHPVYDAAAVRAARGWTYWPATRNGQPVAAQKDIQVRLLPR
jgi:TonB family protein